MLLGKEFQMKATEVKEFFCDCFIRLPNLKLYKIWRREREREMFYLMTHSTHSIYSYMASDIWLRTILMVKKETRCHHIGYSYRLTARVLLYAPSHRQDNTYHSLWYTSCGVLAGTRNSLEERKSLSIIYR